MGNGAVNSVQEEAGVEQTDLFIAVTPSDELNLLCCLIAKKTGNCKTIARVRNPDYLASRSFIKEKTRSFNDNKSRKSRRKRNSKTS